ncbi:MAG TPA: VOC family protein [Candidatus Acidoferrales bacterium]|nr:VOC family protein [Candidatus Acidoferrales bacterium]
MTKKHTGQSWMPADDYGRTLPVFTVNLLVSQIERSIAFYTSVLGAKLVYSDCDFAALRLNDLEFMLHVDHSYDHHPWYSELTNGTRRGLGAELRLFHIDPDEVQERAHNFGSTILQAAQEKPHGWRDVIVADPDGYAWAVGIPTKQPKTQV